MPAIAPTSRQREFHPFLGLAMSFPNTGGATLALPSPTHAHQIDVTSAVRSLRRSISRSPSKFLSRTNSHSSEGSPQSPCRRFGATPQHHRQPSQAQTQSAPPASLASATSTQSPLATPFRPNVKLSLRSAKSTKTLTPTRSVARTRVSPKSPMKRTSNTPDSASRTPIFAPLSALEFHEQENRHFGQQSPATRTGLDRPSRHSCHLDISGASQMFLKTLDTPSTSTPSSPIPPSGTLKRSDATMNLEEPTQGSPVAKRRSLHGISNHQMEDLGIFGTVRAASPNQGFEIHEDSGSEYELGTTPRDPLPSPTPGSHLPKRTSSLRKSTLQQRYGDKGSLGRKTGERHLASMGTDPATPVQTRPRVSNDQFTPLPLPPPRDSIFSQASPLPNPSIHAMDFKRHPLSQFQTASSSGSSLKEQTALYTSVKPPPIAATTSINFAQSLPLNAPRPTARVANLHTEAVATPGRTNLAGTGAFHSTGLISKVNHNPEDEATRMVPPDTPCKKPSHLFNTYPLPPGSAFKAKPTKPNRNSFAGVPSTPYHAAPHETPGTFGNTDRGLSIFFRGNASRNARRGSLLSLEGEESQLPGDTADVTDPIPGEVPPTPTRNTLTPSLSNVTESSLESPSAHRTLPQAPMSAVRPPFSRESTCKSTPREPGLSDLTEDEVRLGVSQPVGLDNRQSPTPRLSFSSFGRARARRGLSSPAPLSTAQPSILPLKPSKSVFAKIASFDSASPVEGRRTPQTPQGNLSVETGFLSMAPPGEARADSSMQPPPVTPTTDRDFRSSASIFVTPVNFRTSTMDLDPTLKRRFEDVEEIGSGEFSLVYRVTKVHRPSAAELFDATPARGQMASPAKPQIFAVKQSKHQFQGYKDRQLKLREVEVLQALRDAEHVVQYVDHWEHNFHLFIQTEFCEEGTLKNFLTHVGQSARLDDFRIFKILQDLCLVSDAQRSWLSIILTLRRV